MRKRGAAPKKITYTLISQTDELGMPMYARLAAIVREHHEALHQMHARIALAWCTSWRPDVDGRTTIGKCKKASDLDRELAPFDFVILLSRSFWDRATDIQRDALLDHECSHAAVKYDDAGEPVVDVRGRVAFRTRKHDLEEFADVAERHGLYKRDLEQFARAVDRARARTGHTWVGYASLNAKFKHAGLLVPVERIVEWNDEQRRAALEWLNLRQELLEVSSGAAVLPPAPSYVLAAVVQLSILEPTGTHGESTSTESR